MNSVIKIIKPILPSFHKRYNRGTKLTSNVYSRMTIKHLLQDWLLNHVMVVISLNIIRNPIRSIYEIYFDVKAWVLKESITRVFFTYLFRNP